MVPGGQAVHSGAAEGTGPRLLQEGLAWLPGGGAGRRAHIPFEKRCVFLKKEEKLKEEISCPHVKVEADIAFS